MNVTEVCAKCGGSGWKITERDSISGAEKCECQNIGREQRLEERANIPPLYSRKSFDTFRVPEDNPTASGAFRSVMRDVNYYVNNYPLKIEKPGLLFLGTPGTGKTHLAVAALRELLARNFEGIFFDYQSLLNQIRAGYDEASGTMERDAYRLALDTEVLVLDDLGSHRVKDFVEDTVTAILTHRCNHRKATIVTSNLRDPELGDKVASGVDADLYSKYFLEERIGMRARSRLYEMCTLIKMPYAQDYRKRSLSAR